MNLPDSQQQFMEQEMTEMVKTLKDFPKSGSLKEWFVFLSVVLFFVLITILVPFVFVLILQTLIGQEHLVFSIWQVPAFWFAYFGYLVLREM